MSGWGASFSSKEVLPSKWFSISHEHEKTGAFWSFYIGWDCYNSHYFVDLCEIDLIQIKPAKKWWLTEITFNWKHLLGFSWLKGN